MEKSDPRIAHHYDELAEYWEQIAKSPSKEQLLWPSIEAMLPDLTGLRVLDAGCGSGDYTAKLVEQGGDVIGVDVSEEMILAAKERVPDAEFIQSDLSNEIDFIEDDSVDIILCQHVFSHLEDLTTPATEFARILVDGGELIISTHNPVHDYLVVRDKEYPTIGDESSPDSVVKTGSRKANYTETERYDIIWNPDEGANRATYYRRSIEGLVSPLFSAGFELRDLSEPIPGDALERDNPELAETLRNHPPASICLHAKR